MLAHPLKQDLHRDVQEIVPHNHIGIVSLDVAYPPQPRRFLFISFNRERGRVEESEDEHSPKRLLRSIDSSRTVVIFERSVLHLLTKPGGNSPRGLTTVWIELGCFSGGVGSSMFANKDHGQTTKMKKRESAGK